MLWLYNINILKVIGTNHPKVLRVPDSNFLFNNIIITLSLQNAVRGGGCRNTRNVVVEIGADTSLNTETPKYLQPTMNLLTP